MNLKEFGLKWSWPNWGSIPEFVWRSWGKYEWGFLMPCLKFEPSTSRIRSKSLPLDRLLRPQNAPSCQHNISSSDILQFLRVEQEIVGIWQSDAYSYFCAVSLLVGVESSTMKPISEHFRVWPWTVFPHFTCSMKGNVCAHTDCTVHLVSNGLKRDHLAPENTRFAASYFFSRDLGSCSSIILFFWQRNYFTGFSVNCSLC